MRVPDMPGADFHALLPVGLLLRSVDIGADRISNLARSPATHSACPDYQATSARVHSRYQRQLQDLPSHGRTVALRVSVRRFRCANPSCRRNTFVEPLGQMVAPRSARRTCRLEQLVRRLGIALDGRPAASLARRVMLPVSKDTLLRVVRRRAPAATQAALHVIRIDDWAFRAARSRTSDGNVFVDLLVIAPAFQELEPRQTRRGSKLLEAQRTSFPGSHRCSSRGSHKQSPPPGAPR
jgi:hypothetical protein